jgi:hypothetical protein
MDAFKVIAQILIALTFYGLILAALIKYVSH